MKVERREPKTFKPISITLETENEARWMKTMACLRAYETPGECCERLGQSIGDVDKFTQALNCKLHECLDC